MDKGTALKQEIEALTRQIDELHDSCPAQPRQTGGVLYKLVKRPRKEPPPAKQLSLMPTLEDEALATIKRVVLQRRSKKARVVNVAKRHSITLKQAEKLYTQVIARLQHELEHEHYLANKEYYDWLETPAYKVHCNRYLDLIDRRVELVRQEFEERVAAGLEHVVAIEYTLDLDPYLDKQWGGSGSYHGPMSHAARHMTENDARILWVNKAMKLVHGNEDTLFNHHFRTKEEFQLVAANKPIPEQRVVCSCGKVLDYNTVGFNRKLGIDPFQCLDCLGIDEDYAKSVISHYRSSGCTMFI